jgi:hypothetical protein
MKKFKKKKKQYENNSKKKKQYENDALDAKTIGAQYMVLSSSLHMEEILSLNFFLYLF